MGIVVKCTTDGLRVNIGVSWWVGKVRGIDVDEEFVLGSGLDDLQYLAPPSFISPSCVVEWFGVSIVKCTRVDFPLRPFSHGLIGLSYDAYGP